MAMTIEVLRPLIRNAPQIARQNRRIHHISRRCFRVSSAKSAQPLGATTPGPPPPVPEAPSERDDAVSRKLKQAELLRKAQALRTDPSKPTPALRKRFWKDVSVKETQGTLIGDLVAQHNLTCSRWTPNHARQPCSQDPLQERPHHPSHQTPTRHSHCN